jgi:hypothetical protein
MLLGSWAFLLLLIKQVAATFLCPMGFRHSTFVANQVVATF